MFIICGLIFIIVGLAVAGTSLYSSGELGYEIIIDEIRTRRWVKTFDSRNISEAEDEIKKLEGLIISKKKDFHLKREDFRKEIMKETDEYSRKIKALEKYISKRKSKAEISAL